MADGIFRVEMLPANQGDALWIEYGKPKRLRRILVDGGPIGAYSKLEERLSKLPDGEKTVELLVITHVDTDHIEGIIRLLAMQRNRWPIAPKDIWFNGWRHLEAAADLGGREGDYLSALIHRRAFNEWNKGYGGKPAVVASQGPLPVVSLSDGMKITLLSPSPEKLRQMADKWRKDVKPAGFLPGDLDSAWQQLVDTTKYRVEEGVLGGPKDFQAQLKKQLTVDQSAANGSSIAFLAEYGGKRCLFLGDAHMDVVCQSLSRLLPAGGKRITVDAVKMAHHGSKANISKEFLGLVESKKYFVSTNGAIHKHPDKSALEAVIRWSVCEPTFIFNYRTKQTAAWEKARGKKFQSLYPGKGDAGIAIEL